MRKAKLRHDVYTNDRWHGRCFPTVNIRDWASVYMFTFLQLTRAMHTAVISTTLSQSHRNCGTRRYMLWNRPMFFIEKKKKKKSFRYRYELGKSNRMTALENHAISPVLFTVVETWRALSRLPVKLTELGTKSHLCHDMFTMHFTLHFIAVRLNDNLLLFTIDPLICLPC